MIFWFRNLDCLSVSRILSTDSNSVINSLKMTVPQWRFSQTLYFSVHKPSTETLSMLNKSIPSPEITLFNFSQTLMPHLQTCYSAPKLKLTVPDPQLLLRTASHSKCTIQTRNWSTPTHTNKHHSFPISKLSPFFTLPPNSSLQPLTKVIKLVLPSPSWIQLSGVNPLPPSPTSSIPPYIEPDMSDDSLFPRKLRRLLMQTQNDNAYQKAAHSKEYARQQAALEEVILRMFEVKMTNQSPLLDDGPQ